MAHEYILVSLLVVVVAISTINCDRDISPEKLQKNLLKINKHLEKNVATDDVSANLAEIEKMLADKSSKHSFLNRGQSLEETLKMLIYYNGIPKHYTLCDRQTRGQTGEKLDAALVHDPKNSRVDYQLTRLDKVLARLAIEDFRRCSYYRSLPQMEHLTKQIHYDWINNHLVESAPEDWNSLKQLAEVEKSLSGLDKSGARADAVRQFVELKKTVNADTCNLDGYQILLANDLATRKRAHTRAMRRIDKLFLHYVEQHELVCRPIYINNFRREIQELDAHTYRSVLYLMNALASFDLILTNSGILEQRKEDLSNKEVNADFYTPFIEASVRDELKRTTIFDIQSLAVTGKVKGDKVYKALELAAASDPNEKYLRPVAPRNADGTTSGPAIVQEPELKALVAKYLFEPCHKFLDKFEEQVEMADYGLEFGSTVTGQNIRDDKNLNELMSFHLIRGAVHACQHIYYNRVSFEADLIKLARTGGEYVPTVGPRFRN